MVLLQKRLTTTTFNSIITPVFVLMVLLVGTVGMACGNLLYCFVGIFWVYLAALFYGRFWVYPDPSVDCHSVCNFVACDAVFGKNNQLYAMHVNSFVKSFCAQLLVFIPALVDYFLYSFREKIWILYRINLNSCRFQDVDFLAVSLLAFVVIAVYGVRDVLRVLVASRRLGESVQCKNVIFCGCSLVCMIANLLVCVTASKLFYCACFALWIVVWCAVLCFVCSEGKGLKRGIEWNRPSEVYFKIFTSSSVYECIASESLAVLEGGDVVLLKNGSMDVKYRKSSDVDKIVLCVAGGIAAEYHFDEDVRAWV